MLNEPVYVQKSQFRSTQQNSTELKFEVRKVLQVNTKEKSIKINYAVKSMQLRHVPLEIRLQINCLIPVISVAKYNFISNIALISELCSLGPRASKNNQLSNSMAGVDSRSTFFQQAELFFN